MSPTWIRVLGVYHAAVGLLILYLLITIWPARIGSDAEDDYRIVEFLWGYLRIRLELSPERQVLFIVLLSGALGSYVHAATSFVNFTGTRSLVASWRWWYALRPLIGGGLALGFYFAARAGFFAGSAGTADLNLIGFAATAFMVGMFSKQATQKLAELFDTLFRTAPEHEPPKDKMDETPPPAPESKTTSKS
jgi:hypothetical protein